jgi:hypothetical protein
MKKKNCYLLTLSFSILFFGFQSTFAQDKNDEFDADEYAFKFLDYEFLVGLRNISLRVSDLPKELEELGVTKEQLQTEAEIRLRRAGMYDEKSGSYLNIFFDEIKSTGRSISYNLRFYLSQPAKLERNNLVFSHISWERTYFEDSEKNRIQKDIRENVGKNIDKFIENLRRANGEAVKKNNSTLPNKQVTQPETQTTTTKQKDSPFTATYVGGDRPPTVEIFNDSNRTMYLDFGQGKMTAYTIPSGGSQKINLSEAGNYKYKASAPRVRSDEGQEMFKTGYAYTWRFYIVTVPR